MSLPPIGRQEAQLLLEEYRRERDQLCQTMSPQQAERQAWATFRERHGPAAVIAVKQAAWGEPAEERAACARKDAARFYRDRIRELYRLAAWMPSSCSRGCGQTVWLVSDHRAREQKPPVEYDQDGRPHSCGGGA